MSPLYWLLARLVVFASLGQTIGGSCPSIVDNLDYAGNDLFSTYPATAEACCTHCAMTPGCRAFSWSNPYGYPQCYLKSKQGVGVPRVGVRAGVVPPSPPQDPGGVELRQSVAGAYPMPSYSFHYLTSTQWMRESVDQVHARLVEGLSVPPSDGHHSATISNGTTVAMEQPAAAIIESFLSSGAEIKPYLYVESISECAMLTATAGQVYFTYIGTTRVCLVHAFSPSPPILASLGTSMKTLSGEFYYAAPQRLASLFELQEKQFANVTTDAACRQACASIDQCAGSRFGIGSTKPTCTLFGPDVAARSDVSAGWVVDPIVRNDHPTLGYASMAHFVLQDAKVSHVVPSVQALDACAAAAAAIKSPLFQYHLLTRNCSLYAVSTDALSTSTQLVHDPATPVVLPGLVLQLDDAGATTLRGYGDATTAADCHQRCIPSADFCIASSFDDNVQSCDVYLASNSNEPTTLGWLTPYPLISPTVAKQVHVYGVAHQDDHELFMSSSVFASLSQRDTRAVFVYVTAGDAGQANGWWQAREAATLAGTEAWVQFFGHSSPARLSDSVVVRGHTIARVTVGNAVHYFFRVSETGFAQLANTPVAPLDQPTQVYATWTQLQDVVQDILVRETSSVASVALHAQEFEPNGWDHDLHRLAGHLFSSATVTHPTLARCVHQTFYYGYQRWASPWEENHVEPLRTAQRYLWMKLTMALERAFGQKYIDAWSQHADNLGRTYASRTIAPPQARCVW
ncbi:Aste57867_7903 [Aphanomyces stellatus]|uniref:Aste57867_7903 protein n=1 Tax=Aphanomyces stellatus TaxID=120398 RepID=A0A485KIZ3_9STRA|nr:hypothetical protein As57867_007873 [Aphanomyces stellatus]VFT84796.1 Aste57867_7903 [Aphanomyces stellatus]